MFKGCFICATLFLLKKMKLGNVMMTARTVEMMMIAADEEDTQHTTLAMGWPCKKHIVAYRASVISLKH